MKKLITLVMCAIFIMVMFCGCSDRYSVKVEKSGKTEISLTAVIPVKELEKIKDSFFDEQISDGENSVSSDNYMDEYLKEIGENFDEVKTEKVDGIESQVYIKSMTFSSTSKANKFMINQFGEEGSEVFKKFKVSTKQFEATVGDAVEETELSYQNYKIKLTINLPYTITKTNGTLLKDKKTVEFDLLKTSKPYAYTTKSDKSAEVYFKKVYLKSNSSVYLDWNSVNGAQKYKLKYKSNSDEKWTTVTTTKSAKTVKGLKAGKTYTFKVTAVTEDKEYTSIKNYVSTLNKVTPKVKSKTDKKVELSWSRNIKADGYIVYKKTSSSGEWKEVTVIEDPYTASYTVKKLKSNKKYYFKVVSYSLENGEKVKSSGETITAKTKKS